MPHAKIMEDNKHNSSFETRKKDWRSKSYRPISLLCVPFKLLERIILSRINPFVEAHLPETQASFRSGRSTSNQVLHLTSFIEDGFQMRKKTAAVLIDLTSAYDTIWYQGLRLKLL